MSSNSVFPRVPAGVVVILAVLCGTLIAQPAVPASDPPDKAAGSSSAAIVTASIAPLKAPAANQHPKKSTDGKAALIAEALNQPTDLNIQKKAIGDAFDQLGEQTGIPIVIDPGTFCLLPEDSRTTLSATSQKTPLRESLTALLRPIALGFDIEDDSLVIRPTPPLRRMPKRATWQELGLLEKLATTPWSEEFAKTLEFQFQPTSQTLADVNRGTLLELAAKVGAGTATDVLEQATNHYGWTWHVCGKLIVVLPKTRQIGLQLERRITADYSQFSVQDTLLDLTEKAGVPLRCDPGALASLSPFVAERFHIKVSNTPIHDVLDLVAGQTGLNYYVEPEGVRITACSLTPSGAPVAPHPTDVTSNTPAETVKLLRESSVVIQLELPPTPDGKKITLMVRRSDLPDDLKDLVNAAIKASAEPIRVALRAATQPHD